MRYEYQILLVNTQEEATIVQKFMEKYTERDTFIRDKRVEELDLKEVYIGSKYELRDNLLKEYHTIAWSYLLGYKDGKFARLTGARV